MSRDEIQNMPLNLNDTTWRFWAQYRLLLKIHKNISVMDKKYEEKTYYAGIICLIHKKHTVHQL